MRIAQGGLILLMTALLAACASGGGGGGGGTSGGGGGTSGGGGGSSPPPPPPTNTSITNLVANQTFTAPAATSDSEFNLTSGTTASSAGAPATISVSYNAAAKSYTVSVSGRSETFGTADVVASPQGETRFQKDGAGGRDRLTLVTTPYSGAISNRYVGLGYWQHSNLADDRQPDQFATFVYGLNTPAAAMPRTGRANFAIDVFGLATVPGYEPSVLQGNGTFDVDFMAGVFSTHTYLTETGLVTGAGIVGGGIELIGAGLLSSSDPSFSGNVTVGTRNANLTGSLSGGFYGPGAEEVGASFSATNSDGATVAGSFTGQRASGPAVNLTLTNLVAPKLFYAQGMALIVDQVDGQIGGDVRTHRLVGQFNDRTSGNFSYGPGLSSMAGGEFTTASIVSSGDPDFTVYRKTFGGREVQLELLKIGPGSPLALTYSTLGRWQSSTREGVVTELQRHHFVYGLETPERLLATRTGSARYEGVAYGAGANRTTGAVFDVRGASVFNVDFSRQAYSGNLTLNGRSGSGTVDFGRYDFTGQLGSKASAASLTHAGAPVGDIVTRFFGPTGEEIGGDFFLLVPEGVHPGGTLLTGATVARRQ